MRIWAALSLTLMIVGVLKINVQTLFWPRRDDFSGVLCVMLGGLSLLALGVTALWQWALG